MKAKFNGKCHVCGGVIHAGDEIRWSRAEGARHWDAEDCREAQEWEDARAEQAAEMRMEGYAEAHLMGVGARAREEGWF